MKYRRTATIIYGVGALIGAGLGGMIYADAVWGQQPPPQAQSLGVLRDSGWAAMPADSIHATAIYYNAAYNAALPQTRGSGVITTGNLVLGPGMVVMSNGDGTLGGVKPPPEGAIYHQVVDRYLDKDGKPVEIQSATHVVDPEYCHGGRRQQDLIATIHDNGHGEVWIGDRPPETSVAAAQ